MNKLLTISVVVLALFGSSIVVATSTSAEHHETRLCTFTNYRLEENNACTTIEIDGANSQLLRTSYYIVPSHVEIFTYPFGTQVESVQCTPSEIHRERISNKLPLAPEPRTADMGFLSQQPGQVVPQALNTWYEYTIGTGLQGNERCVFLNVRTYPVQYHPDEGTIDIAESITIEVSYKEPTQQLTFNENGYNLIILAPTVFLDELEPLVTHKNNEGMSAILVSLDDIYNGVYFSPQGRDDQEKIKYFIKDAIETWGTNYVLLVGGEDLFPVRESYVNVGSDQSFACDFYYADIYKNAGEFSDWDTNSNNLFGEYLASDPEPIDEVDLHPDVNLGRLACVDEEEVSTCVDKIVTYETTKAYTQNWFSKFLAIGGDSAVGDTDINEGEYQNAAVIDVMPGLIPTRLWVSNGILNGISPSGSQAISNAFDDGYGFVDFSGHGNTNVWATHPHDNENVWVPTPRGGYFNTNIESLKNGDYLPIVISDACCIGKYTSRSDCWSWSLISNPSGGAIATIGSTSFSYFYPDEACILGLSGALNLDTFKAFKEGGAITVGEMWTIGINSYNFLQIEDKPWDYKQVEEWQLFADPSLRISTDSHPPETPSPPNGPTQGHIGSELTYTASTTDIDGDQIYYSFDWGNGEYSDWIGPYESGATAEATYTWSEQGDYNVRVTAKDVNGKQSDWSQPLGVTLPKQRSLDQIIDILLARYPRLHWLLQIII
jgi:hypothetical protein